MERDVTRRHSKTMNIKKTLPAVVGFFIASAALAAEQFLPTPPPSAYADGESSVNVPLPTTEGRYIKLTFSFDPSPSNAVQVVFGRDVDADGDLAPEETELIVGCDCGVPVVGVESSGRCSVEGVESSGNCNPVPTATPAHYTFALKQPKDVSLRCNLAKVTMHNLADTNLTVTAEFYTKGTKIILR